jgi:hypothetical protein
MTTGTISIIAGVTLLILFKLFFKGKENLNQDEGLQNNEEDDLFKEEPEVDPSWSLLPGNVWHSDDD